MSFEIPVVRYVVPIHLRTVFKGYIHNVEATFHQSNFVMVSLFTVFGTPEKHQKLRRFLQECQKERRLLLISNRKMEAATKEVEMWGLNLEVVKRGLLYTKATVTGDTKILDRLERLMRTESIL